MKKLIILPMLLLITAGIANRDVETGNVFPYPIYTHQLPNGLNVVTVPYESPGIAAFYIIVRVGSRDEVEPGKSGFAHFFEHMMFRGTEKYSKQQYSNELKAIGASANANTWLDRTVYHMTGNAEMLDKMFELEADRFMNLKYSVSDFKTEAGAVKGEYTKNFANLNTQLNEKINDAAFLKHTYKHTTMGFIQDIVDMPNQYEYSLEFFKRFYRPEYSTILVVGDVTPEKVQGLSEKYFGKWERGTHVTRVEAEPVQAETRFAHIKADNFPPYLSLSFKSPAFTDKDKDSPALSIILSLLFSERSELYKRLVIKEQKLRSLSTFYLITRDPYLFQVNASLKSADDMQYIKNEIMKEIEKLKTTLVDPKLLAEVKSNLKYSLAMNLDSPDAIANALSLYIWVTGDPLSLNNAYKMFERITPEDVMGAARRNFLQSSLTIGTIGPNENGGVN